MYEYKNKKLNFLIFYIAFAEIKGNELEIKDEAVTSNIDAATEDADRQSFVGSPGTPKSEKDAEESKASALSPEDAKEPEFKVEISREGSINGESNNEGSLKVEVNKAESIKSESVKSESIKSENIKEESLKDESLNDEPELTIALPEPMEQDNGELSGSNFLAEWSGSSKYNGGFKKESSALLSVEPQKRNIVKSSDMYVWNW